MEYFVVETALVLDWWIWENKTELRWSLACSSSKLMAEMEIAMPRVVSKNGKRREKVRKISSNEVCDGTDSLSL
jgi:hypothetical protein